MGICEIQKSDIDCHPCHSSLRPRYHPKITADLPYHFDMYKRVVIFLKSSRLFKCMSPELIQAIRQYIEQKDCQCTDQTLAVQAVRHVANLYPEVSSVIKTEEWLLQACLKHHIFVRQFPIQNVCYQDCLQEYFDFLSEARHHIDQELRPSQCADFMWHVHMQDTQAYKIDCWTIFGFILNHRDDQQEIMNLNKKKSSACLPSATNCNNVVSRACEPVSPCHDVRPCHDSALSSGCHEGSRHC